MCMLASIYCTDTLFTYVPAVFQDFEYVVSEGISVLIQQTICIIEHLSSIVSDAKLSIAHLWLHIVWIVLQGQRYTLVSQALVVHCLSPLVSFMNVCRPEYMKFSRFICLVPTHTCNYAPDICCIACMQLRFDLYAKC